MEAVANISNQSVFFMGVSTVLSLMVPIAFIVYMAVKRRLKWKATLFGVLLFFTFVMILESIMHYFVLGSDMTKSSIYKNLPVYVLYAGFAAGIFEETARFLFFRFILRSKIEDTIDTGISYGLGHGGIEAVLIGGLASIGNLISSIMYNKGLFASATSAMSPEQLEAFNNNMNQMINTPSYMFLITGIERVTALVLQIALSLFVIKAVREKKWQYLMYAVLIHAGVDMLAVLFQRGIINNIFLVEVAFLLIAAAFVYIAFKINKSTEAASENVK